MELGDYQTFCSGHTQLFAQGFLASLKYVDAELGDSFHMFIKGLALDADAHILQRKLDKAEKCYTLTLRALEILAKQKRKQTVPPLLNEAFVWSNRAVIRYEQGKHYDAFKDAENSLRIDPNHTDGYWAACLAQKGLGDYAKAAYFLILALSRNLTNDYVGFVSELAILVTKIKDKEELKKYNYLAIITTTSLDIWIQIVETLSERNEFEAIAILTTGVCENCCVSSSVVHNLASIPGLSFGFLNVGRMLKFLADKEGTKSWHLKLAEFVVKRGADLLTVERYFKKPFLIAMTTLSVEGGLPSFLSLAWEKLSPENYDQKDSQGNTAFHILTKHGKCTKQISEIICRELLDHGCLVTEVDGAGKFSHEYIPVGHTIYKRLTDAMKTPEKGVRERIELIRKDGNNALTGLQRDRAIELYQKALLIASKFSALHTEAAILHSNLSAVYLKKEAYAEAAMSAENSLKADPKFCKGYYRKGQALSKMGNNSSACKAFISGFHLANEDSMKNDFSTESAKILLYIPDADSSFLKEIKQVISYKWSEKIKFFTQNAMWAQLNSLFLGPPYENYARNATRIRAGIMANSDASQAVLSTIFQAVESSQVDAPALLTLLLQQRASPASLASSKETYFHAAIRFCILTSNIQVLKFILENDTEKNIQSSKDFENRSPLHTLCIESEKRTVSIELFVQIAILLAEKKVDFNAKDKYQRSAADYVISRPELKKQLDSIVSNISKHTRDEKSAGAKSFDTCHELKEKGNAAFRNANYKEAFQFYSQGLNLLEIQMQNRHEILSKEDGRTLAVLYGNRAECSYKQGDKQMFLQDAKKSVDADGSWYKGHWRVGKAYRELGKGKTAIKAFVNTLKALTSSDGVELKCQILSDLVETIYDQNDRDTSSATAKEFYSHLWPQLAYNYIVGQKWHLAEFLFKNCASPPANSYNFDLSPFCNKDKLADQRWVCALLLWFLLSGADHKTLKFHKGDTYFHATISIFVMSGYNPVLRSKPVDTEATQLLTFVLVNKVIPSNEINIRDNKGNTVLHLLATLKGPDRMREFLANYLLDNGVDVTAENFERKQAVELVSSSDVIRSTLQVYLNKSKFIDKLKEQKKQDSGGGQNSKFIDKPKEQKKQDSSSGQNSKQQKIPEIPAVGNTVPRKIQMCDACEKRLAQVSELLKWKNIQEVFSNLVQVVNCRNSTVLYHKNMTNQAIERIASLLASIEQDIPSPVIKLSAKNIKVVLTSLANLGCWTQLELLVTKFRQNKGQHALPDFAKNMSLIDLIKAKSLVTQKSTIMNLINLFVQGGAPVDAESLASSLEAAMTGSEWQVVLKLLELGADPSAMTLNAGDTPYHAALQVALHRQPGYFELLMKLKQLDDNRKAAHKYLNVSCQDMDGNTLLHIATQAKFSQHSLHAVELLCQWNVLADICNKEKKLAIQYLPNDKDRRYQYLKMSVVGTVSTGSNYSVKTVTGSSRNIEARPKTSQQSAPGTSLTAPQMQRAVMETELLALPDVNFNFLTYDRRVNKRVEVVQDVDSNDSDEEREFEDASDVVIEITDGCETESHPKDLDIDVKAFDNLEWDIECTEDVWSTLRSRKEILKCSRSEQSEEKKQRKEMMPHYFKQMIVQKVQQLASGDWGSHFQQRITDTPESLQLFKISLPHGACILWELAIAFSPRLSESAETILADDPENATRTFVVRGSKIYSELIRVWSIVLKQSELQHIVHKIIDSHERGKSCIIQKNLEALSSHLFGSTSSSKRIPILYVEINQDKTNDADMKQGLQRHLFPPASAHKNEYHVLKFYSFSSSMVSAALNNSDANVDFPFRVTDIEHAVINLKSVSPLLLLGRSGTGKTTCCLYRLWRMFFQYWEQAIHCGTPMLQRRNDPPEVTDYEREIQESQKIKENKVATKFTVEPSAHQAVHFMESHDVDSLKENVGSDSDSDGESVEDTGIQYDHLHQLFVTKNPVLCKEVHKNFMKLCNGTEVMQTNVCQNTDLPNTLQDVREFSFPLFLTSRQLLLMLDASIDGNTFFPRDEDLALKVTIPGWGTQEDIFNIAPLEHDDLFDNSGDDVEKNSSQMRRVKQVHTLGARPERKVFNRRECTYDVFAYEVWPKVTKKVEIDCHPSLVWTEIMSFIKGSYESLHTEKGYLDKTQYLKLGRKRAPNFTANRDQVYDVFLGYHLYKQHYSLFDEADLVYNIYCRLRTMTFQPWILHEIYVDETQDFTQAELALLISLCSEPNKMFLTGDTAQSIMRGISFRFDDLRTLFFCVKGSADKSEQHLLSIEVPQKVHQLTHNYRSHTGILSLASSVLDVLLELFRDSFDPLEKDQGMFAGPKPIIIESSSPGDLALLLTGSKRKTSHIEFGAHQAVLVVSERAKAELPEELGAGIVLTIFESKGLEFDDVLIYNFFKDSQAKKEWRVITNFLTSFEETDMTQNSKENLVQLDAAVLAQPSRSRPLPFDPNQHKVLNSELKHLYTAITRARVNVWIFDEDEEKRAPMFEYFRARGLVKCMGTKECANVNEAIMFADKSSTKEWRLAGDKYMLQKLYTVAAKCYKLAEQPNKERIALAYQTALEASRMGTTPKAMKDTFFKAGTQFVECRDLHHAALCFQNSQDFHLSAIALEKNGKFEEASNQYLRAQKANDASRCLEQVGMFGRAIRALVDHELFDRAIDCLRRYEMEIQKLKQEGRAVPAVLIENKPKDVHSEANLCYRSATFHYSKGEMSKAIAAIKRSRNTDDQILFMQEKGFWEEAAEISKKEGKTEQAARLMLKGGNTDMALEYAQEGFHRELRAFIHLAIARRYESKEEYSLEKIQANATKALNIYTELEDYNGQAQAKLLLGKHQVDEKQLSAALRDFRNVKPQNQVAELECLIATAEIRHHVVSTLKHCQEIIKIVTFGQNILDVLLNQKTENSDKYRLYLNFYGMELDSVRHQVTWYPNQYQPCKEFLNISSTGKEKKSETLKEVDAVSALMKYLMSKIEKMGQMVQDWLEKQKFSHLPCIRIQEGQSCSDDCKYNHKPYESTQEEIELLNLLICSVNLDYCMHPHMERIAAKTFEESDLNFANREESKWNSVEELLDFVLPAYPSAQRSHHEHTQEIVNTLRSSKVQTQVARYFHYLWNNPGRVGKGLSTNVLKERCKSTKWIVQACFFASLLRLPLDVNVEVKNLEAKLMSTGSGWAHKRYKYALFTTRSEKDKSQLIEAVGTRFLQSFNFLTKDHNALEALFPFTKMISTLGDRNNLSLMPKLNYFIFWIEFYISLTWLFMAKVNQYVPNNKRFYMTSSYLFTFHILSACIDSGKQPPLTIPELVVQHTLVNNDDRRVMDRQSFIINFLVGHNKYSKFSLINQVNQLCQAEPPCFGLAERILILSALVLLNIPGQYVKDQYEVPIRRELSKLSVTKSMPTRLASLVKSLKSSSNYPDVAAALFNYFHQQGCDRLILCQLLEKERQPMKISEAQLSDSPSLVFFDADIQAEIEKTSIKLSSHDKGENFDDRTNEEQDEVDIKRQEAQKAETEQENRKKAAIKLIIHLLQVQVMRSRLHRKAYRTFEQEEMFKPFAMKDTLCGICAHDFKPSEAGTSEDDRTKQSRDLHYRDGKHMENLQNFTALKNLYISQIHSSYQKIMRFVCEKKVENNSPIYKDIELDTSKVLTAQQVFDNTLRDLLNSRKWGNKEALLKDFTSFENIFAQHRQHIETVYEEYKKETRESHSHKATVKHKETMGESIIDLDFTDSTLNATGFKSQHDKNQQHGNRSKN